MLDDKDKTILLDACRATLKKNWYGPVLQMIYNELISMNPVYLQDGFWLTFEESMPPDPNDGADDVEEGTDGWRACVDASFYQTEEDAQAGNNKKFTFAILLEPGYWDLSLEAAFKSEILQAAIN